MVVSIDRPPPTAVTEQPLPRCQTIVREGISPNSARIRSTAYATLRP